MKPSFLAVLAMALIFPGSAAAREVTFAQAKAYVSSPRAAFADLSRTELQFTYRWLGLRWELRYVPKSDDLSKWKQLLDHPDENYYARLCAACFLVNTDATARTFLEQEIDSPSSLRHRYNAAKALLFATNNASPDAVRDWEIGVMIRHLNDGTLDQIPVDENPPPDSAFPDGDVNDINGSPIEEFCQRLAVLKVNEATPAIITYLQRQKDRNGVIVDALGDIGNAEAIPYLRDLLKDGTSSAYALGKLKCVEAAPLLITKLSKNNDPDNGYFQGPDDIILRALRDIGDTRAIEPIRHYLEAKRTDENETTARRVLVELSSKDPVRDLIVQYGQETSELARGDILMDLAERYPEARTVAMLDAVAENADSTYMRSRAIDGLGQIGTKASLTALGTLLARPFPNTLSVESGFRGVVPDNFTPYFHGMILAHLRAATQQDFGEDAAKWQEWIARSPST